LITYQLAELTPTRKHINLYLPVSRQKNAQAA